MSVCFTVRNFWPSTAELIDFADGKGFQPALLHDGDRAVLDESVRKHDRCMFDDSDVADRMWQKLDPYVPPLYSNGAWWRPVGLNPRLRVLRYFSGDYFKPHTDGSFRTGDGKQSLLTLLVYLNDTDGGATRFAVDTSAPGVDVTPETGSALVFEHKMRHEGLPVKTGHKLVLRTDVMYEKMSKRKR